MRLVSVKSSNLPSPPGPDFDSAKYEVIILVIISNSPSFSSYDESSQLEIWLGGEDTYEIIECPTYDTSDTYPSWGLFWPRNESLKPKQSPT